MARGMVRGALALLLLASGRDAAAIVYYVSSVSGNDANNGTSPSTPFATVNRVNALALQPGDQVRFFCGETWRAQPLEITRSGATSQPIVFSSHPVGCAGKPILSGAHPVGGFVLHASNVWVADLSAGANAGRFPLGVNQVFRGATRLPFGRWPNIQGHPDGGYAEVDAELSSTVIADAALPPVAWTGAVMHIKGIRWYMMNRDVVASSPGTLTVNDPLSCWNGCAGWGYFLSNHLATLDAEGEWYYDAATFRLYVYSTTAPGAGEIEASAILPTGGSAYHGGITLGRHLQEHVTFVTIENLRIERWFDAGISTPTNLEADENQNVTIRANEIRDVDSTGIRLATWVWDAANNGNGPDGWRGGRGHAVDGNVIERANHFGIDTYGRDSTYSGNTVRDVGLIANLGRSGMGCGNTGTNCTENGAGIRIKLDEEVWSAWNLQVTGNAIDRVGMNGIDVFGAMITVRRNVIDRACASKGDCGAIRTFGRNDLATTPVHDLTIQENVIREVQGNTDGCAPAFETLFGFGIYVDNYSRDVAVTGNTVVGATWVGVLFQRSTGTLTGNVVYGNSASDWGSQLALVGNETRVASSGNVFFSLGARRRTMNVDARSNFLSSNGNYVFSPYEDASISSGDASGPMTLAGWQAWSGMDGGSRAHFYSQAAGTGPRSRLFVNATAASATIPIGAAGWVDLDQAPQGTSLTLPAYGSEVLVAQVPPATQAADIVTGQGHGPGNPNQVRVWDGDGSATAVDFLAYGAGSFGTNVASGDVASTTAFEILTGPGPGSVFGPQVRAFDRAGVANGKVNFFAYGTLKFGANVGAARLDADAWHEIVSGPGPGGVFGPHVRGWNVDSGQAAAMPKVNFFAYGTLKFGAQVGAGNVDGDAYAEMLTGPGPGVIFGAQVRGWNYDGAAVASMQKINFLPYVLRFGVQAAGGDVDLDGFDEIATAPGTGYVNPQAYRGFDYDGAAIAALPLYDVTPPGGAVFGGRLAMGDAASNYRADLVTAPGPDSTRAATVRVYVYDGIQSAVTSFAAFSTAYGANTGAGLLQH